MSSFTVLQRFAFIIDSMKKGLSDSYRQGDVAGGLLSLATWRLLSRLAADFAAIAARVRDGTRRIRPAVAPSSDASSSETSSPRPIRPWGTRPSRAVMLPYGLVPTGFAWLVKLAQRTAGCGTALVMLIAEPEMAALVAADQRLNRIVRSLFWMLAVKPPPGLPPLPRRKPRPAVIRDDGDAEKVRRPRPLACIGPTTSARARSRILRSLNPKSRPLATPEERARAWGVPLLGVPSKIA